MLLSRILDSDSLTAPESILSSWKTRRLASRNALSSLIPIRSNIAGPSLDDRDLLEFVAAQIAAFRLDPARLSFEITETAAISDLTAAGRFVEGVRTIGARVGLDDFGSGSAPLSSLHRFRVTGVKMDRSFTAALTDPDAPEGRVAAALATMALLAPLLGLAIAPTLFGIALLVGVA